MPTGGPSMKIFRRSSPVSNNSIRRILIRCPNWIGDAVMATPTLSAIRGLFPRAELTVLAPPGISELLQGHPAIDHHLALRRRTDHAGVYGFWTAARILRLHAFDLAILLPNAFGAAWLAYLAGIPQRYGYRTDGRGIFLTHPVTVPAKPLHQVEYYLNLLIPLGNPLPPVRPMLCLAEQEQRWARGVFTDLGIGKDDFVLALNPGSVYGNAKRWPPERFAEAADRLVEHMEAIGAPSRTRGHTVILGACGEEPVARRITERMQTRAVMMTGRTSIRELMAILAQCDLLLTNDTGPMHVAAALDVPLVSLFGPTDPVATAAYGLPGTIVRHPVDCSPCLKRECPLDHRCMTGISVEGVVAAGLRQVLRPHRLSQVPGVRGTPNAFRSVRSQPVPLAPSATPGPSERRGQP